MKNFNYDNFSLKSKSKVNDYFINIINNGCFCSRAFFTRENICKTCIMFKFEKKYRKILKNKLKVCKSELLEQLKKIKCERFTDDVYYFITTKNIDLSVINAFYHIDKALRIKGSNKKILDIFKDYQKVRGKEKHEKNKYRL